MFTILVGVRVVGESELLRTTHKEEVVYGYCRYDHRQFLVELYDFLFITEDVCWAVTTNDSCFWVAYQCRSHNAFTVLNNALTSSECSG